MAKKISQLTQATEVKSDDVTVIVQDGETKKLPLNMMVTKQDIENKKIAGLAKLDEIEATYENDTYTPTITVKNKSSVKVGEGDGVDYSANVMDGHVKSAILKGQTKIMDELGNECESPNIPGVTMGGYIDPNNGEVVASEVSFYTTFLKCPSVSFVIKGDNKYKRIIFYGKNKTFLKAIKNMDTTNTPIEISYSSIPSTAVYMRISASTSASETYTPNTILLIEDTNGNNLYTTHLESVKMPVLKATGKNLFDDSFNKTVEVIKDGVAFTKISNGYSVKGSTTTYPYFKIGEIATNVFKTNKVLTVSFNSSGGGGCHLRLVTRKPYTVVIGTSTGNNTYNLPSNITELEAIDIELACSPQTGIDRVFTNIQIEVGSTISSFESFKSNILSVSEDIELRGIGNVRDELNLLTSKVTERIRGIVLDGSQPLVEIGTLDNTYGVRYVFTTDVKTGRSLICDKLTPVVSSWSTFTTTDSEEIAIYTNAIAFKINKNKLSNANVESVVEYLKSNPIKVQYPLAQESVKTVDLMPSGTHPSTTPYCWKNGLIQLSSSGLLPNLEYSVVTSRAGQINQNATMIVKNDKRIFDLEILLAGGLVNTTYQALTLQNQVETGLSKVSLNSETEPDYLLYHMIMKLIEEKAYKLDDLTEKVSVFYLYEKLSDTQFETIYSALYPFVEDEIVEEPVVEELPEGVEDEVIM